MPPQFESRIQTLKRAYYLMQNGYDVKIISGSYLHNRSMNLIKNKLNYLIVRYDDLFNFIHIRNVSYKKNSVRRVISLLQFHIMLWYYAKQFGTPKYICHLATVPFGNITYFTAKKLNAKFIVDVVDLWPESFVAYGLISRNNPLTKLLYLTERWLYAKSDALIFSMEGGSYYIEEKKWNKGIFLKVSLKKIFYINNGVDLIDFNKNKIYYRIEDKDLLDESIFKVIYIGSIRLANNLLLLIKAAEHLVGFEKIKILIYGDGDERDFLEHYCKTHNLTNVIFKNKWIDLKYIPFILSKSSLNILNYKPSNLFRYGASQSKFFQYMASGKPICCNIEMAYCNIKKYNIGISSNLSDSKLYANAILHFYNMNIDVYNEICNNAINTATLFDYKKLTSKFIEILNTIDCN